MVSRLIVAFVALSAVFSVNALPSGDPTEYPEDPCGSIICHPMYFPTVIPPYPGNKCATCYCRPRICREDPCNPNICLPNTTPTILPPGPGETCATCKPIPGVIQFTEARLSDLDLSCYRPSSSAGFNPLRGPGTPSLKRSASPPCGSFDKLSSFLSGTLCFSLPSRYSRLLKVPYTSQLGLAPCTGMALDIGWFPLSVSSYVFGRWVAFEKGQNHADVEAPVVPIPFFIVECD
ncbi:hypothetical protein BKA70DRAFT_1229786 [Coprinopsis sp. MPI-PUGE-AT-0042]|nr:hypothetical protein BKA70DRAFT_1229786 [Coprinopsis sp. MPI-PUGE-AT-0042]